MYIKSLASFRTLLISILSIPLFFFNSCAQTDKTNPELDKKIGQMLMVGFRGLKIDAESPIVKDIEQYHLGGVVLFDYDVPAESPVRNIESPEQVTELVSQLQQYSDIPLFISIDQEGGKVVRLKPKFGFKPTVSTQYLGDLNNADSTRKYALQTAQTLKELGINMNLAPSVDVNLNPDNPIIGSLERSYSSDPEVVTRHARIYLETLHRQGIITSLKHFPGHGSSEDDSHEGVTDVTSTWQEKELIPFRNLIESGHADVVMTAHIYNAKLDPSYPATLSEPVITGVLRDSLDFNGVIMSDDLQMKAIRSYYGLEKAIRLSLEAGVDILVFANNSIFDEQIVSKAHKIITDLVESEEVSPERIERSYQRIMNLKEQLK